MDHKFPKLEANSKLADVIVAYNNLVDELSKGRDRGPASTREMTPEDATRVLHGDLKDRTHKDAAEILGLSYGQVYSCRKGFTFKTLQKAGPKVSAE